MRVGDHVADFELRDHNGQPVRLYDLLADGAVVLFFYPAALTRGCTAESCHFRDLTGEFRALGARPVGISADAVDRQREFADTHGFDYPLLSDPDGVVATAFGVRRSRPMSAVAPTRRRTFVIDPNARVRAVIRNEVRMAAHADGALRALREPAS
ncbi:peroxiredoxin [Spiractinospora alimapuensis]|uniref:peroxiredoxin n=1 Tax=Spiractinospora alimapuensis TaxID=2820884 RepID=UPI001F3157D4|nr:peroxiredoxin [Spiractinospora alimapuensis]QVQ53534.1 peroxiredoxin [Spiractinospora alimapuensis]